MSKKEVHVLLIEGNPSDVRLLVKMLSGEAREITFALECVDTLSTGLARLAQGGVDVVLLDLALPDSHGLDTLLQLQCSYQDLPVVVLSDLADDKLALEAVRLGAQDCLVKGQAEGPLLARSILYAIERKAGEERIKQLNEERERRIIELADANRELDGLTRKLAQARDQAVEASNFKSEFVAKISHEVRTPVSAVIGMIEFLLQTPLNDEQREFASIIEDSAQSLLLIINEILDLSKMEAGKTELEIIDFSPVALIEGTADLLVSAAREKRLALITFIDPDLPPLVKGDPVRLRQILLNFMGNAIKFTQDGLVLVRMIKEAEEEGRLKIRFDVSDTGIGLNEEARKRLFQPFVQANGSIARKYGGRGLGLAIARRLVELMRGEVGLESEEGEGSTFWFKVELKRSEKMKMPSSSFLSAAASNLRDVKVLLIDSDVISRDILNRYLQAARIKCDWVPSTQEGLDLLRRKVGIGEAYDIAVIHHLPGAKGAFELAKVIKQEPAIAPTRLILLSAFEDKEQSEQAVKLGFASYLSQPVRQSQLVECLSRVMSRDVAEAPIPMLKRSAAASKLPAFTTKSLVLLAEDNPALRELALRQLKKLGLSAHAVATGREAVDAVAKGAYALVLMDCQMPEMNGLEATRTLRESGHRTPIIAMTASAMHGDRESCLAAGMDDYITKPVSVEQLHKIIERWMPAEPVPVTKPAAKKSRPENPIDFQKMAELYGDSELEEILSLFVPEVRRLLEDAESAIDRCDAEALQSLAHQLKGVCASVAAEKMTDLSKELEEAAKKSAWQTANSKLKELKRSFDAAESYVDELKSRG